MFNLIQYVDKEDWLGLCYPLLESPPLCSPHLRDRFFVRGHTSSRKTGGALTHYGAITEVMSEMGGLRSGSQDGRVVSIGATNIPFDSDDMVLRRLPRRLLIDLPGEREGRFWGFIEGSVTQDVD